MISPNPVLMFDLLTQKQTQKGVFLCLCVCDLELETNDIARTQTDKDPFLTGDLELWIQKSNGSFSVQVKFGY